MPQKTLRFKIHQDGRVEETVVGFTGNSCNEATKNLEDALGKVTVKNKTSVTLPRASSRFFVASLHELPVNPSTVSSTLPS